MQPITFPEQVETKPGLNIHEDIYGEREEIFPRLEVLWIFSKYALPDLCCFYPNIGKQPMQIEAPPVGDSNGKLNYGWSDWIQRCLNPRLGIHDSLYERFLFVIGARHDPIRNACLAFSVC